MAASGSYPSSRATSSNRRPWTPPASLASLKADMIPNCMLVPSSQAGPLKTADWPNKIALSVTPGLRDKLPPPDSGAVGMEVGVAGNSSELTPHATRAGPSNNARAKRRKTSGAGLPFIVCLENGGRFSRPCGFSWWSGFWSFPSDIGNLPSFPLRSKCPDRRWADPRLRLPTRGPWRLSGD